MRIKRSHLAGTWYAGTASRLRQQVDELLAAVPAAATGGAPEALIVPHAGYQYSGRAAAGAYAAAGAGGARRALIIAPSHYHGFRGLVVPDFDAFETPLGRVDVDTTATREVCGGRWVRLDPAPFEQEHSLEIQLPLLQRVLPDAKVIPVLAGSIRGGEYAEIAARLAGLLDAGTLLVVSSDFVHYGARFGYLPFPSTAPAAVRAKLAELDGGAIDIVLRGDRLGFEAYVESTGATICGRVPIACLLELRRGRGAGRLLQYYTSIDVTGDAESSVSYAAIVFPR